MIVTNGSAPCQVEKMNGRLVDKRGNHHEDFLALLEGAVEVDGGYLLVEDSTSTHNGDPPGST